MAIYLRVMRASMLEVLGLDFVRAARAKGLAEGAVLVRHVLRNALLPVVTLVGLQGATLLGGSVVVESVFSLPGLGRLAYESVVQRDLNMLLGIVFVSTLLVITVNLLVDLAYARLDPRITRMKRLLRTWPGAVGLLLAAGVVALAVSAPWVFPRDPLGLAGRPLIWPGDNPRFWLGTDNSGRDIAAQIFHGARIALLHRPVRHRDRAGDRHGDRRAGRVLWRLGRRRADARDGGVPDAAQLPAAAGAGGGVRVRHPAP